MKFFSIYFFSLFLSGFSYAADPLNGTKWKVIDDRTNQPTAIIQFNQDKDGNLKATIRKILVPDEVDKCKSCKGKYHNKSLVGLDIIKNLKKGKNNSYEGAELLDPETGNFYRFNAKLIDNGTKLVGRGYIGFSFIGRTETWYLVD
ncbi:DUF2147 domain-containing protein [Acinetobacter pittii]|uniref:DUF2147 domain-containing protein n=1 Tax=Acinetobacter pittii TaxID=48296 RepID=UPI003A874C70